MPPNKNHLPTPMNHSDEEDENEETTAQTGSQNIESFIVHSHMHLLCQTLLTVEILSVTSGIINGWLCGS